MSSLFYFASTSDALAWLCENAPRNFADARRVTTFDAEELFRIVNGDTPLFSSHAHGRDLEQPLFTPHVSNAFTPAVSGEGQGPTIHIVKEVVCEDDSVRPERLLFEETTPPPRSSSLLGVSNNTWSHGSSYERAAKAQGLSTEDEHYRFEDCDEADISSGSFAESQDEHDEAPCRHAAPVDDNEIDDPRIALVDMDQQFDIWCRNRREGVDAVPCAAMGVPEDIHARLVEEDQAIWSKQSAPPQNVMASQEEPTQTQMTEEWEKGQGRGLIIDDADGGRRVTVNAALQAGVIISTSKSTVVTVLNEMHGDSDAEQLATERGQEVVKKSKRLKGKARKEAKKASGK
ncbi:hypothetical protein ACN47E_004794 [Coniothyrium glycines]